MLTGTVGLSISMGLRMITQYEIHPYSKLFPLMGNEEYEAFRADIEANGLLTPIIMFEGKILDGRNRYRCCADLDIEPETEEFTGDNALGYVLSLNLYRRQLSVAQRALIAVEVSALKSQGDKSRLSVGEAAAIMGVSPRSISSASKLMKAGVVELQEAVMAGDISISAAELVCDLDEEEQREICNDGPKAVCKAAKKIREDSKLKPKRKPKTNPLTGSDLALDQDNHPEVVEAIELANIVAPEPDISGQENQCDISTLKPVGGSSTELLLALAKDAMEQGLEAESLTGQILDEVEQGLDMQFLLYTAEAMTLLLPRLKAMSYRR